MRVLKAINFFARYLAVRVDWFFGSKRDLIQVEIGEITRTSKIFIYCHWSPESSPSETELRMLTALKEDDFTIIVVVNANTKNFASQHLWDPNVDLLLVRKNRGRDLAAYRDAINWVDEHNINPDRILFANNSIFWAPEKIPIFLSKFNRLESHLGAATISLQPFRHMQTFFIYCDRTSFKQFRGALNATIRNVLLKDTAVLMGELKLSKYLQSMNIPFDSLYSLEEMIFQASSTLNTENISSLSRSRIKRSISLVANGTPVNPSHCFWLEMIQLGFPGLKKDLILKNPSAVLDIYDASLQEDLLSKYFDLPSFPAVVSHVNKFYNKTRRVLKL